MMTPLDYTLMIASLILLGLAGLATSLWRISRGGLQAVGGLLSLVALGGMLVLVFGVMLAFNQVGQVLGTGGPYYGIPTQVPAYPSIQPWWTSGPSFGPTTGPSLGTGN